MVEKAKNKSLAFNAFLNTVKTVLGMVLALFTFPYVSRVLDVSALGAYNFSSSIVSYALLISGLGVASYAIREGSQYRDDIPKMEKFVSEVFSISVYSTLLSYIGILICAFLIPYFAEYRLMLLILSSEIICTTLGVAWIGNIYEDFLYITVRTLAFQVIYLVCLFIFVRQADDIYKYIIITMFTTCGAHIMNYFYLRKKYVKFHFVIKCNMRKHIKPILVIFSTKIAITLYVNSDKTILGFLTSDYEVGLYSAAVKIYSIVKEILVAMVTVLIPRFSVMMNRNSKEETNNFFSKVFTTLSVLLVPATVGLFVMSSEIMLLVAGKAYNASAVSLSILSLATLFSLYANIYTTCILVPARKENTVFYATVISAIVNIGLNFVLIPIFGINAAATTTVIAEMIIFVLALRWSKELVRLVHVKRDMIGIGIACLLIVMVCIASKMTISNSYLRLLIAMTVSGVVYFVSLLMLKNSVISEGVAILAKRIKK